MFPKDYEAKNVSETKLGVGYFYLIPGLVDFSELAEERFGVNLNAVCHCRSVFEGLEC